MRKFCIVCGNENFSRSKNFCCEKCHQQYYYQQNKEELLEKHKDYNDKNKEKIKESGKKWRDNNKDKLKFNSDEWRKNNRERYNELARISYNRRKEASK